MSTSEKRENFSKAKLCGRNANKGINTFADILIRYSRKSLKWTRMNSDNGNKRPEKMMTTHKALHSRDDIDFMYQEKKEEEDTSASKMT